MILDALLEPLGYLAAVTVFVLVPCWLCRDRRPMDPRFARYVRNGRLR